MHHLMQNTPTLHKRPKKPGRRVWRSGPCAHLPTIVQEFVVYCYHLSRFVALHGRWPGRFVTVDSMTPRCLVLFFLLSVVRFPFIISSSLFLVLSRTNEVISVARAGRRPLFPFPFPFRFVDGRCKRGDFMGSGTLGVVVFFTLVTIIG